MADTAVATSLYLSLPHDKIFYIDSCFQHVAMIFVRRVKGGVGYSCSRPSQSQTCCGRQRGMSPKKRKDLRRPLEYLKMWNEFTCQFRLRSLLRVTNLTAMGRRLACALALFIPSRLLPVGLSQVTDLQRSLQDFGRPTEQHPSRN
ncbi:hypothetical protein TNCV_1134531 [Trichonephila clavipes]|nr:hypothetical protein TNCV_1134531 [Trichonephila clavipes]